MKNIIIILGLFFIGMTVQAQTCDIYVSEFAPIIRELTEGETADLVFTVKNNAKGVQCVYEPQSVHVYLYLPDKSVDFESVIYPEEGKGPYFDWTYDEESRTLIGLNHKPIGDGQGEDNITVKVKISTVNAPSVRKTLGVTVLQNFEGPVFKANDPFNDNSTITLRLKSDIRSDQVSFQLANTDCNEVNVMFGTQAVKDVTFYEIQRSRDGITFTTIATQPVSDPLQTFSHVDKIGLEDGREYTYQLIAVGSDGTRRALRSEKIINDCSALAADFDFFPNPAVDNVFVRLKGSLSPKSVDMLLTNNKGEVIRLAQGISNDQNEINLEGIPSGVYYLSVWENSNVAPKKLIKIAQ